MQRVRAGLDAATGAATEAWWRALHDGQAAAAQEESVYLGPHPMMEPLEAAAAQAAMRHRDGLSAVLAGAVHMQANTSPAVVILFLLAPMFL